MKHSRELIDAVARDIYAADENTGWRADKFNVRYEELHTDQRNGYIARAQVALDAAYPLIRDEVMEEVLRSLDKQITPSSVPIIHVGTFWVGFRAAIKRVHALKTKAL